MVSVRYGLEEADGKGKRVGKRLRQCEREGGWFFCRIPGQGNVILLVIWLVTGLPLGRQYSREPA